MRWIDDFTPKEDIQENDLIRLWFNDHNYDTAVVTKIPYRYFYNNNKFFWRIDLDYLGYEAYAYWSLLEKRWMGREL